MKGRTNLSTHLNQLIKLSWFLLTLLNLISPIESYQIPFLKKPSEPTTNHLSKLSTPISLSKNSKQSISFSSHLFFQLQHAVHITTDRNQNLHYWRNFSRADRDKIDKSASTRKPINHFSLNDSDEEQPYGIYSSSHLVKSKESSIWTHRATFDQWSLSRRSQLSFDTRQSNCLKNKNLQNSRRRQHTLNNSSFLFSKDHQHLNLSDSFTSNDDHHHLVKALDWFQDQIRVPDTSDIETLSSLGKMTFDAYSSPDDDNRWFKPGSPWNISKSFGWDEDGLRGHVFATPDNSTIVISIKGTSAGLLGNGGSTSKSDKINDNLLFSCCCARVGWSWTTVCDCYEGGGNRCQQSCLEDAIYDKSSYYMAAVDLYNDVVEIYPDSQIWLTGHSLGGSLAALLGLTFGVPTVGFEAPGDLLAAKRLHLPLPPGGSFGDGNELSRVTHVFHTADPIAMGVCNGAVSSCSVAGYALETRCHTGQTIIFDTAKLLDWAVDIRTHSIKTVIDKVLIPDWKLKSKSLSSKSIGEEGDKGHDLFSFRWPWKRKKKNGSKEDNDNDRDDDDGIVPEPTTQDCKGDKSDCSEWIFSD
ncbi:Alpha/Beta hydrolase protein [Phakopsora pachyrhizi]|nr:Alpha/Beta hydrolase protein [Phakopsora pachyrhizi]